MHKAKQSWTIALVACPLLVFLAACDREPPKPKAVQGPPAAPETAVGEMSIQAIEKAKGVERTLDQAAGRTADRVKEAAP